MLKELTRLQRVQFLEDTDKSPQNQLYSTFFDYYNGKHFSIVGISESDYSHNRVQSLRTRSGIELYDNTKDDDYRVPVCSNWCRPIIQTIADFTRGVDETIEITVGGAGVDPQEEKTVREVWKKNQLEILTHKTAQEAGIFGKTYLRFRGGTKDKLTGKTAPITFSLIDPGGVHEIINPLSEETEGYITYFVISRKNAEKLFPDVKINNNKTEVYYAEEWSSTELNKFIDGIHLNPDKNLNPYPFMPIVKVSGNLSESSDINDVISLNDELNITLTYINEIFKYHAFPLYAPKGSGIEGNVLSADQLKSVSISPKTIMNFPLERIEGKGVDQSVIEHLNTIQKNIALVSQVPIKLLTAEIDGNTTGIALQRLMSGIIKKAEMRRGYIREAFRKLNNMIVSVGKGVYTEIESEITFPDIVKMDTGERLDEAIKKQTLGISKETIFEELGYHYEEEEKSRQEEFDNSLEKRLIDEQQNIQSDSQKQQAKGNNTKKGNAGTNNRFANRGK